MTEKDDKEMLDVLVGLWIGHASQHVFTTMERAERFASFLNRKFGIECEASDCTCGFFKIRINNRKEKELGRW